MKLFPSCLATVFAGITLLTAAPTLEAQVRHPGEAAGQRLTAAVPMLLVSPPMNIAGLIAEDENNRDNGIPGPLRFGVMSEMPMTFEQFANWEITDDGETLVGRMKITSPGAYSLGVEWSEFEMHPEGKLFLYDEGMGTVFGAYTQSERIPNGTFVVEPFPGDTVILEYQQPAQADPAAVHMEIRGVIYDYSDVFEIERELNKVQSGDGSFLGGCNIDVNCPDGDPYPLHKRAVVRTVSGGGLCSASLINNQRNDGTRYVYTANHCGQSGSTVFRFNYQTSGCGTGGTGGTQSVSGAVNLDNDVDSDGRLMRITNNIPDSYNPYFPGWSRSTSSLSFGMGMHHPGGAPKCIVIDTNGGGQANVNFQGIGNVKCWSMNFQVGGTVGGSSGSPIYDQNLRIRGTLTGGPTQCNVSYYGRLHNFWNDDNVGEWLDPDGTGVTSINGYDPFADLIPANLVSSTPNNGPAGGFTSVSLNGSGFDGVNSVKFGGVNALSFNAPNNSTINATVPAGSVGSASISVTDDFGTTTLGSGYTYTANPTPNVNTVGPTMGDIAGGTTVTISGTNVLGITDVQFGGVSGTNLSINSPTSLTVDTPSAGTSGPVDVLVLGNGSDTLVGGFVYFFEGSFTAIDPGIPGTFGSTPALAGSGDLVPGGSGFTLITAGIKGSAPGVLFVSLAEAALPFKGGLLYTFPILLTIDVQSSILGTLVISGLTIDPVIPGGTLIVVQEAFLDAAAVAGVSMSNGLKIVTGGS
ncbi:MAG: hypothetical protein ACI9EF_000996 [Pseudohongiellaceae bacterium]|jgi:hypothetical protein